MMEMKIFAWHKYRQIMRPCNLYTDQHGAVRYVQLRGDNIRIPVNAVELRRFTGLRDCKGAEIYEGDILRSEEGLHIVLYEMGRYIARRSGTRHKIWDSIEDGRHFHQTLVIGNIYEHPEILETAVTEEEQ